MKRKILIFLFIIFFGVFAQEAKADFMYTFSFDSLTYNNTTYAADSICFLTPNFLGSADPYYSTWVAAPGSELNGYQFSQVLVMGQSLQLSFGGPGSDFTEQTGEVAGFFFSVRQPVTSAGTYPIPPGEALAGRGIMDREAAEPTIRYQYTSGTLTIQSVPEPATLLLLGSGLVGLWGFRRKFKK